MKTKPICRSCNSSEVHFSADAVWDGYKFIVEDILACYCQDCGDEVGWDMISDPNQTKPIRKDLT